VTQLVNAWDLFTLERRKVRYLGCCYPAHRGFVGVVKAQRGTAENW